jgi:hypothetical protein
LRIIYRVHAQLQLRLVWVPALWAHQGLVLLGLDDLSLELLEPELFTAPIAHGDGYPTRSESIAH